MLKHGQLVSVPGDYQIHKRERSIVQLSDENDSNGLVQRSTIHVDLTSNIEISVK